MHTKCTFSFIYIFIKRHYLFTGEEYKDLVEMVLDTDIHHFSQDNKVRSF